MLAAGAWAQTFPFQAPRAGEAVADIVMSSSGADWANEGHESAMADVRVDNGPAFQIMLYGGGVQRKYSVFLGAVEAGSHELKIEQNTRYSAPGASFQIRRASIRSGLLDPVIEGAPVLYARKNTIGKYTDVPMIVYAEKSPDYLTYTVIFSNEDGGTSTRALMARWGRTTDIEYVYRVDLKTGHAIIQGRGHKDIEYRGKLEGAHPLLIPVTDNNMVGDEVPSEVRYQIAPILMDLSAHSREQAMDEDPLTYQVMAKELEREDKQRPFGVVDGHKVSDVRNYLYVEAKVAVENAGVVTMVRRKDDGTWRTSALGRADYSIDRSGWIRTTVELPPGTRAQDIGEIGFTCVAVPDADKKMPLTGTCRVEAVSKIFLLNGDYKPGPGLWSLHDEPVEIPAGIVKTWRLP
jgi:hypothetical protein